MKSLRTAWPALLYLVLLVLAVSTTHAQAATPISAEKAAQVLKQNPRWFSITVVQDGAVQDTGRSWQVSQTEDGVRLTEESHSAIQLKPGTTCDDLRTGILNPLTVGLEAVPQIIHWNDTQTLSRFWSVGVPCAMDFAAPQSETPVFFITEKKTLRLQVGRYVTYLSPLAAPKAALRTVAPGETTPLPLFRAPQGAGYELSLYSLLRQITAQPIVHRSLEQAQSWVYPANIAAPLLSSFKKSIQLWEKAFPQIHWKEGVAVDPEVEKDFCFFEGKTCLDADALATFAEGYLYQCLAQTAADPISGEFLGSLISCKAIPNPLPKLDRKTQLTTLEKLRTHDAMKILDLDMGHIKFRLSPEEHQQATDIVTTQILAHELGHTYGLAHNFAGSLQEGGNYTSAMDYYTGSTITVDDRFPGVFSSDVAALHYTYFGTLPTTEVESCTDEDPLLPLPPLKRMRCARNDLGNPVEWGTALWDRLRGLFPKETVIRYFSAATGMLASEFAQAALGSGAVLTPTQQEALADMQSN